MARYIDADALIKRLGINNDCTECSYCTRKYYCSWNPDPGEICIAISEQPTVTINDHPNEIKVTNCHHIADDSKKGDLISRQDAIDTLTDYIRNVDKVMGTGHLSWDDCKDSATSVLEDVLSAQPDACENTFETTRKSNDLISRQDAIDAYGDWYVEEGSAEGFIGTVKQLLEQLPSAQPERKTGKWIPLQLSMAYPPYQCSCCFRNAPMTETGCLMNRHMEASLTDFCPNCGCRMLKEGDEE